MARLGKIVGAILRDIMAAQHEANMYALKLSPAYRNREPSVSLNPPVACLGEMELTLRGGFTGECLTGETYEIDRTTLLRTIHKLATELSESMTACVLSATAGAKGLPGRLNTEEDLRKDFVNFLYRKLYGHLKDTKASFVNADGHLDREKLAEAVLSVADDKILSHPDLESLFAGKSETIREELRRHVEDTLARLPVFGQAGDIRHYTALEVEISSEELAKLPETCIQTFRLKISPREILLDSDHE